MLKHLGKWYLGLGAICCVFLQAQEWTEPDDWAYEDGLLQASEYAQRIFDAQWEWEGGFHLWVQSDTAQHWNMQKLRGETQGNITLSRQKASWRTRCARENQKTQWQLQSRWGHTRHWAESVAGFWGATDIGSLLRLQPQQGAIVRVQSPLTESKTIQTGVAYGNSEAWTWWWKQGVWQWMPWWQRKWLGTFISMHDQHLQIITWIPRYHLSQGLGKVQWKSPENSGQLFLNLSSEMSSPLKLSNTQASSRFILTWNQSGKHLKWSGVKNLRWSQYLRYDEKQKIEWRSRWILQKQHTHLGWKLDLQINKQEGFTSEEQWRNACETWWQTVKKAWQRQWVLGGEMKIQKNTIQKGWRCGVRWKRTTRQEAQLWWVMPPSGPSQQGQLRFFWKVKYPHQEHLELRIHQKISWKNDWHLQKTVVTARIGWSW